MNIAARVRRRIRGMVMWPFLKRRMKRLGITFLPPNYLYFNTFTEASILADVGCGYEAELSQHLIKEHGLTAFGIDPTRKHAPSLDELQRSSGGRFTHLALAVTRESGRLTFHESIENESGSVVSTHTNVLRDHINAYEVDSISLQDLACLLGGLGVDLLKLDLEGAEYELLANASESDLRPYRQVFVEFHHHCTNYTIRDTRTVARRIASRGFKMFTLDGHNYLFYR